MSALPVELAAAAEMLDEEHQDLPQDQTDNNIYTFVTPGVKTAMLIKQLFPFQSASLSNYLQNACL
jgi:hypothetical protein